MQGEHMNSTTTIDIEAWRFLGGSTKIDRSCPPPESLREEVEQARKLLFKDYPVILPNLKGQFSRTAEQLESRRKAWIDVPLPRSGCRMLAIYFICTQPRSFWNGLEIVYRDTEANRRAAISLRSLAPEELWDLAQTRLPAGQLTLSLPEHLENGPDPQADVGNFPLPHQDKLYTGPLTEPWQDLVTGGSRDRAGEGRPGSGEEHPRQTSIGEDGLSTDGLAPLCGNHARPKPWARIKNIFPRHKGCLLALVGGYILGCNYPCQHLVFRSESDAESRQVAAPVPSPPADAAASENTEQDLSKQHRPRAAEQPSRDNAPEQTSRDNAESTATSPEQDSASESPIKGREAQKTQSSDGKERGHQD